MGTVVVLLALIGVVTLVIRSMIKDKKAGKSLPDINFYKSKHRYSH